MNKAFTLGQVVLSISGHDKGNAYVVVKIEDTRVFVADGKYKLLSAPKAKNPVHLKTTNTIDTELNNKLTNGQKVNDQMIYHTLHTYLKSIKE